MKGKSGKSGWQSAWHGRVTLAAGKKTAVQKRPGVAKQSARKAGISADQLSFRNKLADDDPFILQLTENQLASVHEQAFGEPFPRDQFLRYLQSGAPTVIVEKGKKRIGYYSYLVSPDSKMHVSAMVIDPAHQSDGIGTTVMKHLEDDARSQGVHTMEVFVQSSNTKSLAFTRKLGFVEVYRVTPETICFQKRVAGVQVPTVQQSGNPDPYLFG